MAKLGAVPTNTEFDSSPKIESLEEGEKLSIISIQEEIEKTPKHGYELMRVQTVEHGEMVTMSKGITSRLKDVLKAVETEGFSFDEKDPLTCIITTYTSKQGRPGCKAIS